MHRGDTIPAPPETGEVCIQCTDYGPDRSGVRTIENLEPFLAEERPAWSSVRWINVDGLHPFVVNKLRQHFDFHTLAAEDVLRVPQRPKLEPYDGCLFIVVRMIRLQDDRLGNEQVSLFLKKGLLVTFQEEAGDIWNPIRQRIEKTGSRIRNSDASYLLYALLDSVVDHCFPILERYGDRLELLENDLTRSPAPSVQHRIYNIKHELAVLRRVIWPLREVVNGLERDETEQVSPPVRAYMRDVADHAVQVMDIIETFRETASGLNDLYMSAVSNRMNEIMKVLTIMASLFIPITFVAGVYGMNFEHIPELHWTYSYGLFWIICTLIVTSLLFYFRRKHWI